MLAKTSFRRQGRGISQELGYDLRTNVRDVKIDNTIKIWIILPVPGSSHPPARARMDNGSTLLNGRQDGRKEGSEQSHRGLSKEDERRERRRKHTFLGHCIVSSFVRSFVECFRNDTKTMTMMIPRRCDDDDDDDDENDGKVHSHPRVWGSLADLCEHSNRPRQRLGRSFNPPGSPVDRPTVRQTIINLVRSFW